MGTIKDKETKLKRHEQVREKKRGWAQKGRKEKRGVILLFNTFSKRNIDKTHASKSMRESKGLEWRLNTKKQNKLREKKRED